MFDKEKDKLSPKFEINFILRDKDGKPTGKTKTFSSEEGNELAKFYNRHQAYKAKGRKGRKGTGNGKGKG